ncbi:MAG: TIR domain-containing protein, partial [Synergistaceae bacterium]|nr:TIR domain-containing protein [Synergistaceae bacterium]
MGRIFLSHATEEHELVVHLANYLEKNNFRAWYAPRDIVGGIDYDREIIAAIKDCRAFVLLLSRNSDASEDVKTEVYHAVKFKKQVICLDVDDVEPENLSYLLGMRHRLNWLERRDETLDKLIHDIRVIHEPDSEPHTPEPVIKTPAPKPKPEPEPTGNIKGFGNNYRWAVITVAILLLIGMISVLGDSKPSSVEPAKVEPVKIEPVKPVETKKPVNYDVVSLAKDGKLEELRKAINAGADVNAKNNKGATALIQAAMLGHTATAELLLKNGADINAKNKYGCTALMYAAFDGYPEIAEILITYGANKNLRDKYG